MTSTWPLRNEIGVRKPTAGCVVTPVTWPFVTPMGFYLRDMVAQCPLVHLPDNLTTPRVR